MSAQILSNGQGLPIVQSKGQTWSSQSGGQIILSPQCSVQNNLNGLSDSSCLKPCANPSLTTSQSNVNNIDFINKLKKFQSFIETNLVIFGKDFNFFKNDLILKANYPLLYILSLDLIWIYSKLHNYMALKPVLYDEVYGHGHHVHGHHVHKPQHVHEVSQHVHKVPPYVFKSSQHAHEISQHDHDTN